MRQASIGTLRPVLQGWDRDAATSAALYIAVSRAVQARIRAAYGLIAPVLPPPASDLTQLARVAVPGIDPGFLLLVSRLLPYKNVDIALDAMKDVKAERLVVVGRGPDESRLRASAPPNVTFVDMVTDDELAWLYANSRAVVAPSHEDFGLTPIEAALFGKPAVALAWGGFLDTVTPGLTGVLFDSPTAASLAGGIRTLASLRTSEGELKEHGARFAEPQFARRLREFVLNA